MVCEAMVTCETSFFRNPSAFDRLKTSVFPYLLNARRSVKRLRIWSAGCSTGQEPYSIAILLLENFPEIQGWDVKIVGTDLSARALRQAEAGEYSEAETRRGLSDSLRHAYFKNKSHRWIVDPRVSRLVSFEKFNLVSSTPLSTIFDILFVRNVMIYFSSERRASLFELLRNSIRDDGFLFLGESETIIGQGDAFMFASDGMDYYQPTPR
jgi:chemotaxis protein methyltransferase CheR